MGNFSATRDLVSDLPFDQSSDCDRSWFGTREVEIYYAKQLAYVNEAVKVIVDGRKELANINRPVAVGVVGRAEGQPKLGKVVVRYISQAGRHAPVSRFPDNDSTVRFVKRPSSTGISPVNWLPSSRRCTRLVRLPNSDGIFPVNWLSLRDKDLRLTRLPNSDGISPVNWFWEKVLQMSNNGYSGSVG